MDQSREGWWGFAAWYGAGLLLGGVALGAASVGLLVLPVAIWALIAADRHARRWPEGTGVLAGAGTPFLLFGLANLGSNPCPSHGSASGFSTPPCGGWEPLPWLLIGGALIAAGCSGYLAGRR